MQKKIKLLFIVSLSFICTMNPACKHSTNNAQELYRNYAIKNIQYIKTLKKL
ncbi:hypothetical protein QE439_000039 [Pedobacter agri]|nr:hypothetical protein [Pedobacter agri]